MSKGLLTNPKTMLGIAAAVVIMAVAATAGLTSFVSEEEEAPVAVAAVQEPKVADEPVQASGWDDAGMGDDWGAADQPANGDSGGWGDAAMGVPNASQPTFGSFKPEESEAIDNGGAISGGGPPPGATVTRSSSSGQIISGAAEGAPPIGAPGGPPG